MDILQLAGSLAAILLLALFVTIMFRNRPLTLTEERVHRAVARAHPDLPIGQVDTMQAVVMGTDFRCALFASSSIEGALAIIALGDRVVARPVYPARLPAPETIREGSGSIRLNFDDFTAPSKLLKYDATTFAALNRVLEIAKSSDHQSTLSVSQSNLPEGA